MLYPKSDLKIHTEIFNNRENKFLYLNIREGN